MAARRAGNNACLLGWRSRGDELKHGEKISLHDIEDSPQARIGTCGFERTGEVRDGEVVLRGRTAPTRLAIPA